MVGGGVIELSVVVVSRALGCRRRGRKGGIEEVDELDEEGCGGGRSGLLRCLNCWSLAAMSLISNWTGGGWLLWSSSSSLGSRMESKVLRLTSP